MYTVQMEHECGCFKKSEFKKIKTFDKQQDAYNYANIAAELMNEDFCTKHYFTTQRVGNYEFFIRVVDNPNSTSSCSTVSGTAGGCGPSCGC